MVVQLLFASLAIAGRFVLPHFPAGALVTVRVLGAMLVLLALNAVIGGRWVTDRRDLLRLAALGMLGIAANQTLFLYGLRHTTAINATIRTGSHLACTGRSAGQRPDRAGDGVLCRVLSLFQVGARPLRLRHRQLLCHAVRGLRGVAFRRGRQPLFAAAVAPLLLSGERVTARAAAAGLAIFAGLALVILAERRQHREIPVEAVGE